MSDCPYIYGVYARGGTLDIKHCRGTLGVRASDSDGLREAVERMERHAAEELRRAAVVRAAIPLLEQAEVDRDKTTEEDRQRKLAWRREQRQEKKRRDEDGRV